MYAFATASILVPLFAVLIIIQGCSSEDSDQASGPSQSSDPVKINGKELTDGQIDEIERTYGVRPLPGDYWFDQNGNAGNVGNPYPTVNLYAAAMQNGYTGGAGGGGGDNTWSSRFGAGNYDSGNQRGYISVPGHGPVGYGF